MAADQSNTQSSKKKTASQMSSYSWMDSFEDGAAVENSSEKTIETQEDHEFADLFESSSAQPETEVREGQLVSGLIVNVGPEFVTVDVGYKSEGMIPVQEFTNAEGVVEAQPGQTVVALLENFEIHNGFLRLSKQKAEMQKAWDEIARACESNQVVEGVVTAKVKGGLAVDIGVKAFLPGSQIDVRPVKNLDRFVGQRLKFRIVKFNKKRGNIVLSRRSVIEQEVNEKRTETLSQLAEGQVVVGAVKNITDYGAFVDIGGIDGLLHITDMSWGRVKHPSELFKVGDSLSVKVLKYDREKARVSLGLKQVTPNPWDELADKIQVGDRVKGRIVSLKDYGAFVELSEGIEGLIHVSEMSYRRDLKHPSKILNVGDEIECQVLELDPSNKRLSLGLKQLQENPWDALAVKHPVGSKVAGEVKSVTDFGVFVDIGEGIDGLIHVSDMSWLKKVSHPSERFKKGEKIDAVVLSVDKANEKFSLGLKQMERDPWDEARQKYKVGTAVEGKVTKVTDFGAFLELEAGIEGLVYVSELSDTRVEKASDAAKLGDVFRAEVVSLDPKERRISLSIRRLRQTEERKNFETYSGNRDSKTSLGDLLGAQLKGALKQGSGSSDTQN